MVAAAKKDVLHSIEGSGGSIPNIDDTDINVETMSENDTISKESDAWE